MDNKYFPTLQALTDIISDRFIDDYSNTIAQLNHWASEYVSTKQAKRNYIQEVLEYVGFGVDEDYKTFRKYKEEDNDFWNDTNIDRHYWCDLALEWANWQVDIYNFDLWKNAKTFSEWIEQSIQEYWNIEELVRKEGLNGVFRQGQYYFYSGLASKIVSALWEITIEELDECLLNYKPNDEQVDIQTK